MKTDRSNQLFEQLLGLEEMEKLRRATLESGLAGLSRRRARRRLVRACGAACLLIFPISVGLFSRYPATRIAGTVPHRFPNEVVIHPNESSGTKIITDEELFALFPGRSLALVGTSGHQQLVFLDEVESPKSYLPQ